MPVEDALDRRVSHGVEDCRVGLQQHVFLQTVHIDTGNAGQFRLVFAFFDDDGGQGADFLPRKPDGQGLGVALCSPEFLVFLVHPFHKIFRGDGPPDFIGVGDEHPDETFRTESVAGRKAAVGERGGKGFAAGFQLLIQEVGEAVQAAEIPRNAQADRLLPAFLQAADQGFVAHALLEAVEAGAEMLLQLHRFGGAEEGLFVVDHPALEHGLEHLGAVEIAVDADVLRLFDGGDVGLIERLVEQVRGAGADDGEGEQDKQQDTGFLFHRGFRRLRMVPGSGSLPGAISLY